MKQFRILFLLFSMFPFLSYSQNNQKSFIVTQSGDTIRGNYSFNTNQAGILIELYKDRIPSEIAFNLLKFICVSDTECYEIIKNEENYLLGELLISGKVTLLKCKERFFIRTKRDSLPLELIQSTKYKNINGHDYLIKEDLFKGTLNYALSDCPAITQNLLSRTLLNESSLSRLILKYNNCFEEKTKDFKKDKRNLVIHPGLLLSPQVLFFNTDEAIDFFENVKWDPSFSILAGGFIEVFSEKPKKPIKIRLEVLYGKTNWTGERYEKFNDDDEEVYEFKFDQQYFKTNLLLTYPLTSLTSNYEIRVVGGMSFNVIASLDEDRIFKYRFSPNFPYTISPTPEFIEHRAIGIGLTGGVSFSKKINNKFSAFVEPRCSYQTTIYRVTVVPGLIREVNTKELSISANIGIRRTF